MKKLVSLAAALIFVLLLSVSAAALDVPARFFTVKGTSGTGCAEAVSFAAENGYEGIVVDARFAGCRASLAGLPAEMDVSVYVLACCDDAVSYFTGPNLGSLAGVYVSSPDYDGVRSLSDRYGKEKLGAFIGYEDDLSAYEKLFEDGLVSHVLADMLSSSYAEDGYEDYLDSLLDAFPKGSVMTLNRLDRVLVPVTRGDYFGDAFELSNQYLIARERNVGFCISSYDDIMKNANGSYTFLASSFESEVLSENADFSISRAFEITRPTKETFTTSMAKYTITGTSSPDAPLYLNGEEVERIGESGAFAATVTVPGKYTFSQSGLSRTVILKAPEKTPGGSGTISKITSCQPKNPTMVHVGDEVTIQCTAPGNSSVVAEFDGQEVLLEQKAACDDGTPAVFTATFTFTGTSEYPADEVTNMGKVKYYLTNNGIKSTYESDGEVYVAGSDARVAVKAVTEMAGVEREPQSNGDYITTLRTGCSDYVSEDAGGWYRIGCGGYLSISHCTFLTGKTDLSNRVSEITHYNEERGEKLTLQCQHLPAFTGSLGTRHLAVTLYNTEIEEGIRRFEDSSLMYMVKTVRNDDGTVTLHLYSKEKVWGWDVFTDEEAGTFTIVMKRAPKLSDDPAKPLSGVFVTVCPGHGGGDPGALSVAGEKGVSEFQINKANILAITESLENLGAEVQILMAENGKLDSYGRTDPARYSLSDVYICSHANSTAESANQNLWCGTYVYYHYDESRLFAKKLCDYISGATGRDNEGAVQDYYTVSRLTMCPAVMMEVGFVSNPKEFESLIDMGDIQKTALAVTRAVLEICDN